jgi:tetratricopeptide (TPR) repeat protein
VLLARAYFSYRCKEDFAVAERLLADATHRYPNNPEILQAFGFVLRRRGGLAEAIPVLRDAYSLDPRTVKLVWAIAESYRALREYEEADRYFDLALALAPDQAFFWEEKALNRLAWTGKVSEARAILNEASVDERSGLFSALFLLDLYERSYKRALGRFSPAQRSKLSRQDQGRFAVLSVIARERLGEHRKAAGAAEENRSWLEAQVAGFPDEPIFKAQLAVTLAQLGRTSEAVSLAEKAVCEKETDAFLGPSMIEAQAMVDAILGRRDTAIKRLRHLLALSYRSSITSADLVHNPVWDPLRNDPAFKDLVRRSRD